MSDCGTDDDVGEGFTYYNWTQTNVLRLGVCKTVSITNFALHKFLKLQMMTVADNNVQPNEVGSSVNPPDVGRPD